MDNVRLGGRAKMKTQISGNDTTKPFNHYTFYPRADLCELDFLVPLGQISIFRLSLDGHFLPIEAIAGTCLDHTGTIILTPMGGSLQFDSETVTISAGPGDTLVLPVADAENVTAIQLMAYGIFMPQANSGTAIVPQCLDREKIEVQMLWQQITAVGLCATRVNEATAIHFGRSLSYLIEAAIGQDDTADRQIVARFKQYVEDHLFDEELAPDRIAQDLGMSRASLYRVAAPLGGVTNFIRDRRLAHAHVWLKAGELPGASISNLALDLGFGSEATFRRQFKKKFGHSPREAMRESLQAR